MCIIKFIEEVEDPRDSWKIHCNLSSLLFTALCAVLSGAQTWDGL
ncbi:transposase family protein [Candidatus Paracaedibacter symbiosus]